MADLKLGDVVTLRSGGPPMTVAEFGEDSVKCVWTDTNTAGLTDIKYEWFPAEVLEKSE